MDEMLRSLAKRRIMVPNSLEPGIARQAEHAPAIAHGEGQVEPATMLHISTDPPASDSRNRTTVSRRAKRENAWLMWGAVALGLVAVGALVFLASHGEPPSPPAPAEIPQPVADVPPSDPPRVALPADPERDIMAPATPPARPAPVTITPIAVRPLPARTQGVHPQAAPRATASRDSTESEDRTVSSGAPPAVGSSPAPATPIPLYDVMKGSR
jgi:type IV secretory pathway VirB10-like protein